ncbi:hypothetical protein ACJMK2_014118, partial [Sinanodonta woodiana]
VKCSSQTSQTELFQVMLSARYNVLATPDKSTRTVPNDIVCQTKCHCPTSHVKENHSLQCCLA